LFVGIILVGPGSAFYHLHPGNGTLVWDRLPMTIVFMSLLAATISEVISEQFGIGLLFPLIIIGILSVMWWHYTEGRGRGDLRPYIWVQFYPATFIALLLGLFYREVPKPVLTALFWVVFWYGIAKVFEVLDLTIYKAIGVSGHTLKHLAAGVSCWYLVVLFKRKFAASEPEPRR
jgi:hypothetical protein